MLLEILALLLLVVVAFVLVCRFVLLARTPAPLIDGKKPIVIGFFHPYCNSGGGGERVLWCALRALGELHKKTPLSIVVYTGDTDQKPEAILARAMDRFGVELSSDLPVRFEYLKQRDLLEASMYPRFTMIGQSIGSMVLTWEALRKCSPDIWMDTTGFAFSFPLAKYLAGCKIGAYVHYPTISMDMLGVVAEKRPTYNNDSAVSNSALKSTIKLYYYHLFAYLYTWVGRCCDVVMVNSHWTQNHILQLWQQPDKTSVVFPPCDTLTLQQQPLSGRKRVALSVGQFRPEKDHSLQLRAFKLLITGQAEDGEGGTVSTKEVKDVRLALVGSCRGEGDEGRVAALREEAKALGISDRVDFQLNVSWEKLQQSLGEASCGLHTMWNEHFGMGVVEMQAAGMVTIAHNSGGPKEDIVQHGKTGFLASTPEGYAQHMGRVFTASDDVMNEIRLAGRASAPRFSDEVFHECFQKAMEPLLLL